MKVLASLFRVVFSIILLLLIACYLQTAPAISLSNFCQTVDSAKLLSLLSEFNVYTVTLVIILLLGILSFTRILEAVWNVLFCASIIILLASGLYIFFGPAIALPQALQHNVAVNQALLSIKAYEVPLAITTFIFIAGWMCSLASVRVAITTIVSYALWYGLTVFFTYIVQMWANSATPAMPEALHMIQGTPWVIAAVPGAFFLIYALLMALFETFITAKPKVADKEKTDETKTVDKQEAPKSEAAKAETNDKPAEPAAKSQPILKTAAPASAAPKKKLKLATPAPEEKAATETKPEPAVKTEPTPKPEPEASNEVKAEAENEAKPASKAETKAEPEAEAKDSPETKEKTESTPAEAKPDSEQPKEEPLP